MDAAAFYAALRELEFDLEQLQQLSDQSLEFEQELLQLYLKDLPPQLTALQQAVSHEDWRQVEQIAHYIKGASASIGAITLSRFAGILEQQASQPASQLELVRQLFDEFERLQQRLLPLVQPVGQTGG